jgi:hypothetical protein
MGPDERELALMLACCSRSVSFPSVVEVRDLLTQAAEVIDWTRFLDLVESHGVLPIVEQSLRDVEHLVPSAPLNELQQRFREHVRRTLRLTELLGRVMAAFEEADVSSLPHKGPVLAQRLYGDVAMRQFSDLDFFVRESDLEVTKNALRKIGFVPHVNLRSAEEKALLASGYELTFDGMGNRNLVEIQWRVLPRFYSIDLRIDDYFSTAQKVEIGDRKFQTARDEDLLLILCAHAAKHAWARLSWICDIAQLISMGGIDWARIAERATAFGIKRILGTTFFLVGKVLDGPVPAEMESLICRDPEIRILGTEIIQRMGRDFELDPESIAYFRLMFRTRERVRDRVRFVMRLILTPTATEWSLITLPVWLFPLYRLVRIFRLIGRLFVELQRMLPTS